MTMGRKLFFKIFVLVLAASFVVLAGQAMAADEKKEPLKQYIPVISYWTGPFAAGVSCL